MSDTIKLIIEIPQITYEDLRQGKIYSSLCDAPQGLIEGIQNGTPLSEALTENKGEWIPVSERLPDNATNDDALNYMLRQTFPRVIFIHFHNEANLTEGIVMSKEWLSKPYEKGNR